MIYMVGRGVAFGYRKSAKSRLRCKTLRRLGFCLTLRFASPSTPDKKPATRALPQWLFLPLLVFFNTKS